MNHKIITIILVVALIPILLSSTAETDENVFYVSLSGNDSNPGTHAEPWRTITHAARTVTAGDIIQVSAGNYGHENIVPRSGITIIGNGAIIEFGDNPEPNLRGIAVYMSHKRNVSFENLEIRGYPIAVYLFSTQDSVVSNTVIDGTSHEGLFLDSSRNNTFENIIIRNSKSLDIFLGNSNGNTFENIQTDGEIILNPHPGENAFI